ncbi:centrosomal protein of 131 kDa-like isoform X2 [Anneissia japonica]|uniref:centrosomal protein of 131 kDa-like isoform X2 n=1 Tax=Anneissia japonica TaxID=1529436 RepID=UPI0014257934|nr:centrosomal protein of 131 kDa-like isoform X2 [Anneissia japonica]
MDLSLTGSQIASQRKRPSSAGRTRPGSAGGGSQPSSSRSNTSARRSSDHKLKVSPSGDRKTGLSNGYTTGSNSAGGARPKHRRATSNNFELSSHRSVASDVSSPGRPLRKSPVSNSNDDFLALFNSSHKPIIQKPRKLDKSSSKKASGDLTSARAFQIPSSARSSSTIDSFQLNTDRHDMPEQLNSLVNSEHRHPVKVAATFTTTTNILRDSQTNLKNSNQNPSSQVTSNNHHNGLSRRPPSPLRSSQNSLQLSPRDESRATQVSLQKSNSINNFPPPVNQDVAEEYIATVNKAACTIQRSFRKHLQNKKSGEDEIRRLLGQKKQQRQKAMMQEQSSMEEEQRAEFMKQRRRDEKARLARQEAIKELQKKRQQRQEDIKKMAEDEIKFLQKSGKVSKAPVGKARPRASSTSGRTSKARTDAGLSSKTPAMDKSEGSAGKVPLLDRPATASSVGRRVDEIFEESTTHRSQTTHENADTDVGSEAKTKTTLTDLLDTLKLLEEPVSGPTPREETEKKKGPAWLDIFDKDEQADAEEIAAEYESHSQEEGSNLHIGDKEVYLSAENLHDFQHFSGHTDPKPKPSSQQPTKATKNALLTEDKLRSIMTFLDEVEKTDQDTVTDFGQSRKTTPRTSQSLAFVPSAEDISKMEEASAAASEIANTVLTQKLQLEEKERSLKMLQKSLSQQRELTVRHAKEQDKEMKRRVNHQKEEYESTIKRHLSFIDQLIDDKKLLSEKYDTVLKELKDVEKKYSTKINTMEESHGREIQKLKEVQAAAEKIRREKWIDEKTKKIKEITVKGLEPEIQRLIAKHKAEVKKIKTIHEAEQLQSEERAGQKYIRHIEELREQLADEKDAACARERELAKQRYEKQLEQEESAYQQQRRRMYAEIQEEKERLSDQSRRQRQEMDRLQAQIEENSHKGALVMRQEFEKAREEQERRHVTEVRELEERLKLEKEAWVENYMKKQETLLLSKERELREHVRQDRDKEIELVIQRLEDDATVTREEVERTAENRIKRIRDKYEGELREMELSERNTQERYNDTKARLADVEGDNIRLNSLIKQKQEDVNSIKQECDTLSKERKNVQEVIRQEFADRLVATEEENRRLKNEMSEMRARHKLEIERIEKSKEEELEEVHKRVKQAIVKKEDTVNQLRQQYDAATKRADHLEALLEQQRKQLLSLSKKK